MAGHLLIELEANDYINLKGGGAVMPDRNAYGLWSGQLL